jgi:hypothetical protein
MLKRRELVGVAFAPGLVIVFIGVWGWVDRGFTTTRPLAPALGWRCLLSDGGSFCGVGEHRAGYPSNR